MDYRKVVLLSLSVLWRELLRAFEEEAFFVRNARRSLVPPSRFWIIARSRFRCVHRIEFFFFCASHTPCRNQPFQ